MTKKVSPVAEANGVRLTAEQLAAVSGGDYAIWSSGNGQGVVFDESGNAMFVGTLQECYDWIDSQPIKFT